KRELFDAHGFNPATVFVDRNDGYYDFRPELNGAGDWQRIIDEDEGIRRREAELQEAFDRWWQGASVRITALPDTNALMTLRQQLIDSFEKTMTPVGLLDRFEVAGAIATWWGKAVNSLKTLMAQGFSGVVDSWVTSIVTGLEEGAGDAGLLEHPLLQRLVRKRQPGTTLFPPA